MVTESPIELLPQVCGVTATSFQHCLPGALSGGGCVPSMLGLVRHWRLGGGDSTLWSVRSDAPNWAHHGKELNPLAMSPVVSGSEGRPRRRPAREGVPMMGLLHKGVQAIAVGVHERGAKSILLGHKLGLGQTRHRQ